MINNNSGFLSVSQLARSMNYSRQAILKAIKENRLDAYRIGKAYFIKVEEAERWRIQTNER